MRRAQQPTEHVVMPRARSNAELAALVRRAANQIDPSQAPSYAAMIGSPIKRDAARHRFNMVLALGLGRHAVILGVAGADSAFAGIGTARNPVPVGIEAGGHDPVIS